MAEILQRILAAFVSVITFLSGLFGVNIGSILPYMPPIGGVKSLETKCLYEKYNIPEFKGGKLKGIYESSGDTIIGRYEKTTEEEYNSYVSALTEKGYSKYDTNTIEDNKFATLINDVNKICVSRFARTKTLRIIAEPKGNLCPLTDKTEGQYDTLLTGMKGETSIASEGMGFIIRLADGSFCIIDGGMGDADHVDSDKLMNILSSQKPANVEKPVIAAWIFSHLHGDHIGVFNCFSIDHHDDVVIENIYFNFPKEDEIKASDSPYMLDDTIFRYTRFKKCLSDYYADVPVVKLHSGNRFAARNASFEVLYTYDDLYPLTIVDGGMNEDSLLIKMTVGGQKILWTGDIAFNATDLVLWEYKDALSADILQMAHHGMNGTVPFYSLVKPKYALLPVWSGGISDMLARPQNRAIINDSGFVQLIVTACGTWTIKLPYNTVPDEGLRIPNEKTVYPAYPTLLG